MFLTGNGFVRLSELYHFEKYFLTNDTEIFSFHQFFEYNLRKIRGKYNGQT